MATWASRRKFIYSTSVIGAVILISAYLFFSIFYKAPTCFDGKQNGNELGIDCGGSCMKLCQSAFLPARIEWGGGKAEKITDNLYNVASYVVNPNTDGAAINVPYKFSLYDDQGILIADRQGVISLPAHRNTLAFESAVDVGKRTPAKVTFEFTQPPVWFKSHDTLGGIVIADKKYTEDDKSSSLQVTLQNNNLTPYGAIGVSAVLYDSDGNAIGFSRTKIDSIDANGGQVMAPFTWPFGRQNRVVTIEILPTNSPVHD